MKREEIEPLFKSGHEACRFAYAFSSQQYPMTVMGKLMRGQVCGSGRGLFGLEGAAVAGTVKRHVESMSQPYPFILAARYEIDHGRAILNAEALVRHVLPALGTGGHHRHMVLGLICRYFKIKGRKGESVQLSRLCDEFGLSSDTMTRRWRAVRDRLREMESRAQSIIDGAMQESGLVP